MEYYEWSVINPYNANKKGQTYNILKKVAMYLAIFAIVLILILMPWGGSGTEDAKINPGMQIFFNILIILSIELPLWGCFFLFHNLANRYFDYDYFILGDILKIVKIFSHSARKSVLELNFCNIDKIGLYDSDSYNLVKTTVAKPLNLVCNPDNPHYMYLSYQADGGNALAVIEYDPAFFTAMRKALKRESIIEKDLLLLNKKIKEELNDIS